MKKISLVIGVLLALAFSATTVLANDDVSKRKGCLDTQQLPSDTLEEILKEISTFNRDISSLAIKTLKEFISNGGDINDSKWTRDSKWTSDEFFNGKNLFHMAVYHGNLRLVKILLENGADHSKSMYDGETSLGLACRYGYEEIVKVLVEKGAKINDVWGRGKYSSSSLINAIRSYSEVIVKYLIDNGVDVNQSRDKIMKKGKLIWPSHPLAIARMKKNSNIIEMLEKAGAKLSDEDKIEADVSNSFVAYTRYHMVKKDGLGGVFSPLCDLCGKTADEIKQLIMDNKPDINTFCSYGITPLLRTVKRGNTIAAEELLREGADPNAVYNGHEYNNYDMEWQHGFSGLYQAASKGDQNMVAILIKYGADVDQKAGNEMSPLIAACANGHEEVARKLVEAEANVNAVITKAYHFYSPSSNRGLSPLLGAIASENLNLVMMLIYNKADVNQIVPMSDDTSYSLFSYLKSGRIKNTKDEIIDILIENGAKSTSELFEEAISNMKLQKEPLSSTDRTFIDKLLPKEPSSYGGNNGFFSNTRAIQKILHKTVREAIVNNDTATFTKLFDEVESGYVMTPLDGEWLFLGIEADNRVIVENLISDEKWGSYAISVNSRDRNGKHPLYVAYRVNNEKIIELLTERGAKMPPSEYSMLTSVMPYCSAAVISAISFYLLIKWRLNPAPVPNPNQNQNQNQNPAAP